MYYMYTCCYTKMKLKFKLNIRDILHSFDFDWVCGILHDLMRACTSDAFAFNVTIAFEHILILPVLWGDVYFTHTKHMFIR